jgi:hypothetical protein
MEDLWWMARRNMWINRSFFGTCSVLLRCLFGTASVNTEEPPNKGRKGHEGEAKKLGMSILKKLYS